MHLLVIGAAVGRSSMPWDSGITAWVGGPDRPLGLFRREERCTGADGAIAPQIHSSKQRPSQARRDDASVRIRKSAKPSTNRKSNPPPPPLSVAAPVPGSGDGPGGVGCG